MIRDLIIRITGMRQYVTTLQIANEHLSRKCEQQANTINQMQHNVDELRENGKKLYAYNQSLESEKSRMADAARALQHEIDKLEDKNREETNEIILHQKADIVRLSKMCNEYNEQCAKFQHEVMKLRGTIGGLKKQLNKYEKKA